MKWVKPSGVEIETNDREETIEYCESLGWKPIEDEQADSIVISPATAEADISPKPGVIPEITAPETQEEFEARCDLEARESRKEIIEAIETKEALQAYMDSIGLKVDMRGGLEIVRAKALEAMSNG